MGKQLIIKLSFDGTINSEVKGIKGKKCVKYIQLLEELLDASTIDSDYTREYYEQEQKITTQLEDKETLR